MLAELTTGVLINLIYDFIKKGYQLGKTELQTYVNQKNYAITDETADEVIECIRVDDTVSQVNNQQITADTIAEHINNSPAWAGVIEQLSHVMQNGQNASTKVDTVNANTLHIAGNNYSHSGEGDIVAGDKILGDNVSGDKHEHHHHPAKKT